MKFNKELEFEHAVIDLLTTHYGWNPEIIHNPTEEDLIKNWADILYKNNCGIDFLNGQPLTDSEMHQILEQIQELKTPVKLNQFINGKSVSIKRDNPNDTLHFGKEISLKIYDRNEIAGGTSRYQIAEQPKFKTPNPLQSDRRGDFILLINGMPLIHVELKRSDIPIGQACNQIEKYMNEGVFSGLFSLIQIFVAMTPEESVYFANPGKEGKFSKDYFFHWADSNNVPINDYKEIASTLLSIPLAHQLIGFYTIADSNEGILKVLRSYQYYAASKICSVVNKREWNDKDQKGGYIWHTTGSGKTMTSFKAAQLIANSQDADKVVFLMDRVELGTQSLINYKGFADDSDEVSGTDDTVELIGKLKSPAGSDTLIVTSIQKMSRIKEDPNGSNIADLQLIRAKRLVFIIDEAHRSTFGDMLIDIKNTFPFALFFGFTGTPINDENQKNLNTTATVFGNELHRYTIADAIPDKNVLGFDPYQVLTYKDKDLRKQVALMRAKAATEADALADPEKEKVYYEYMDSSKVPMAGFRASDGSIVKGIEDFIPDSQYEREEHQKMVVEDIIGNWMQLSRNSKFHAILATSSIPEAMCYYRLIKKEMPALKITALFDPTIDNNGSGWDKEKDLLEIIEDYNTRYGMSFSIPRHTKFKEDVSLRLAHKEPYLTIHQNPEKQIDLLIVVNQMLTGFDSKWLNTLYLDKLLRYEGLIQAFSRTNRLFGPDKPFGTIRYYRYPHTMKQNIDEAVKMYSGDRPVALFVERLEYNMEKMNSIYADIVQLFQIAQIENFEKLPDNLAERGKFASLFKDLNMYLEAAKIQGFKWSELTKEFKHSDGSTTKVAMDFTEEIYLVLKQRYKDLKQGGGGTGGTNTDLPFEIEGYLTEIDTEVIDTKYMNSRFEKFLKALEQKNISPDEFEKIKSELHKSFASLSYEDQKYANLFLHDLEHGTIQLQSGKTLRDYITEYKTNAKSEQLDKITEILGLDRQKLVEIMQVRVTEANINEFGRLDALIATVDKAKAKAYFEALDKTKLSPVKLNMKMYSLVRDFILQGGFYLEMPDTHA